MIKNNLSKYKNFIKENSDKDIFDDDYEYLNKLLKNYWYEEEDDILSPGDRIIYNNSKSEHNGKLGTFTDIREDGKYRILFDNGKKFVCDSKNLEKLKVKKNFSTEYSFKNGDRITYVNSESKYDGESGIFLNIRYDGKYRILFDSGAKLAASPEFVKPE